MNQTRNVLLDTINLLLGDSPNVSEVVEQINELYKKSLEKPNAFSIENIFFGSYLHELLDSDVQNDRNSLQSIKNQLLGQEQNIRTYVFKFQFVELLLPEAYEAYKELSQLLEIISRKVKDPNFQGVPVDYDKQRESLYQFCYGRIHVSTLMELILTLAGHILLSLPDDSDSFDVIEIYSSIFPVSSTESVESQLNYVKKLLRVLNGEEVIFLDIHLQPDGNFISILR